jgi:hypothetical protein
MSKVKIIKNQKADDHARVILLGVMGPCNASLLIFLKEAWHIPIFWILIKIISLLLGVP